MAIVVYFCVDQDGCYTTFSFLVGALTSMACGSFGMHIATYSNYRTTICAKSSLGYAFKTAFRAGVVIGFALVSVAMLILLILILAYQNLLNLDQVSHNQNYY